VGEHTESLKHQKTTFQACLDYSKNSLEQPSFETRSYWYCNPHCFHPHVCCQGNLGRCATDNHYRPQNPCCLHYLKCGSSKLYRPVKACRSSCMALKQPNCCDQKAMAKGITSHCGHFLIPLMQTFRSDSKGRCRKSDQLTVFEGISSCEVVGSKTPLNNALTIQGIVSFHQGKQKCCKTAVFVDLQLLHSFGLQQFRYKEHAYVSAKRTRYTHKG
jgi:hypothetical protein